jgi:hypothetical protein
MRIEKYYSPDGGDGGGAGDNAEEQSKFQTLDSKGYDNLSVEEKTQYDSLKAKYEVEYTDEEGKPLPAEKVAEIKQTQAKVVSILAKPENERTQEDKTFLAANYDADEQAPTNVYQAVDEITGRPVEVDYEGVAPNSPEGVIKREEVIRKQAAAEYDDMLKESFPDAYRYMKHLQKGGKAEDYFTPQNRDYTSVVLTKTNVNGQESFYRSALEAKGNKPAQIEALIQLAKDKGTLFDDAKGELEALQERQQLKEEQEELQEQQRLQREQQATVGFVTALHKEIEKGVGGNPIPLKDRMAFRSFIQDYTMYKDGQFMVVRTLDTKNLSKEIQAEWFRFKGGDINSIAQTKAKTLNAVKIKGAVAKVKVRTAGQGGPKQYVPLGAI